MSAKMQWCDRCQANTLHVEGEPTVCQRCGSDWRQGSQAPEQKQYTRRPSHGPDSRFRTPEETVALHAVAEAKVRAQETEEIGEFYKKAVRSGDYVGEALAQMCFGLRVLGDKPNAALAASEWKDATRDQARAEVLRRIREVH